MASEAPEIPTIAPLKTFPIDLRSEAELKFI